VWTAPAAGVNSHAQPVVIRKWPERPSGLPDWRAMGMQAVQKMLGVVLALGLCGCSLPRDPDQTLERVEGGTMRVGVTHNPPFVRLGAGEPQGLEPDMVRALAAELNARVQWVPGAEGVLLKALKSQQIDLAAVGATAKNPWVRELGAPSPYGAAGSEKHLLLAPPGENAWLLRLDRFIAAHKAQYQARLSQAEPAS
jgi:hypothetical protein